MRKLTAVLMTLCLCVPTLVRSQTVSLSEGTVLQKELAAGETNTYTVTLRAGEYLALQLEERGINLALKVYAPDATLLSEDRTAQGTNDKSDFRMVAATAGDHRIEILSLSKQPGRYELRVEAIRVATEQDRNNASAHQAWRLAQKFEAENTFEGRKKAIDEYWKVVEYRQATGDRVGEGKARALIGSLYFYLDDRAKAIEYLEQSLNLFRAANDPASEAVVLTNLGAIHQEMGEPIKAIESFRRSLPIMRSTGDRYMEAAVVHNLGWAHQTIGEFRQASEFYREALLLWRAAANVAGESQTVNNLGLTYFELGDPKRSVEYFETSLALRRAMKDPRGEAQTLGNLAAVYADLSDTAKSLNLFQESLSVGRTAGDKRSQSRALIGLSFALPDTAADQSFRYVNEALELARDIKDRRMEADALSRLGDLHRSRRDNATAVVRYMEALELRRATGDDRRTADILFALAALLRDRQELDMALAHAEEGLRLVESVRGRVSEPDLKTSFQASVQSYYGLAIDVFMRLHEREPARGFDIAALQVSERARARGLLDALREYQADIRQGIQPELLERERRLQASLNLKEQQWRNLLASSQGETKAAQSRRELDALLDEFRQLQGEVRVTSPRYAILTQPQSIALRDLQRSLDENTMLLEYWLGFDRSFLWTVTADQVRTFVLPSANSIEQTARRYFAALIKPPVSAGIKTQGPPDEDPAGLAANLSSTLIGPVAEQLGTRRLIIVSHGALQYLPFAALPVPRANAGGLLIDQHEIVSLPSASILPVLRAQADKSPPTKMIAILADPVFSAQDPRLRRPAAPAPGLGASQAATQNEILLRSAGDSGVDVLRRLRFSRIEADAIASLVPANSRFQAMDFQATRAAALSPELEQYRILHFATHGLANNVQPEFSGLVFSTVDQNGQPQDGMLRLHEIFNLSLKAELVVLSACQTALGREVRGEGLIGLTRGFMHAGAPRVVASLWNVEDRATAELMKRFYEGMFKRNLKPAAALRAAQLALLQDKRWSAPYYWAGFTLQGEWR